jgi:hypothetical protein
MSHQLVNLSPDLLKLRNEGYEIEIRDAFLLVHGIPYVNKHAEVKSGTLVSELTLSGDRTTTPGSHTIHFIGEHPCNKDGSEIAQIKHQSSTQKLADGLIVNHSFSGRPYDKPSKNYDDYYEKITRYVGVISAPAQSLDKSVSPKTFKVIESTAEESVFNYLDTNSSRAEIIHISNKLKSQKVGIVGVGGTGSYILDFLAKTPVSEIHLFDDDEFLQHNAFRAPGAASIAELQEKPKKVIYHQRNYSKMRKNIFAHEMFLTEENLGLLADLTFVFICLDKAEMKKFIVAKLEELGIPFIDVGMGVKVVDDKLIAVIRTTSSRSDKRDHVREKHRISFEDPEGDPDYLTNIQIAELNALNAAFAVIRWKKFLGFYHDSEHEFHSTYTLNANLLLSEETYEA